MQSFKTRVNWNLRCSRCHHPLRLHGYHRPLETQGQNFTQNLSRALASVISSKCHTSKRQQKVVRVKALTRICTQSK